MSPRSHRRRCGTWLALAAAILTGHPGAQGPALAETETPPDATAPAAPTDRLVTRNLALGDADLAQVEEMLGQTLSPQGSYKVLKVTRALLITDTPENIEAVRSLLTVLSQPAPNVRIEVVSRSVDNETLRGGSVSGKAVFDLPGGNRGVVKNTPGVIRMTPSGPSYPPGTRRPPGSSGFNISGPGGAVDVDLINQKRTTSNLASQFLLVRSGGTAVLEVVQEIPMVDYFLLYGVESGFIAPEVRWEKAGTQLLVKPIVSGDLITLEVTPRISAVVIANPKVFRERPINRPLTGREQYVSYTQLTTSVTVRNGATVTIGGFSSASDEFNRHFFGGGASSLSSTGSITLKASLQ